MGALLFETCVQTHERLALSSTDQLSRASPDGYEKRVMLREGLWCSRFPALLQVGGRGQPGRDEMTSGRRV